ncbi:hypothetical protein K8I85_14815 [bacterium]|nr:hypothetical protein [bacterium]
MQQHTMFARWTPGAALALVVGLSAIAFADPLADPVVAFADPLRDLVSAVARFRGIGDAEVRAYTVPFTLPDEEDESIVLLEAWRAPSELALGAKRQGVPRAVVRSWALFLEPMFVTRTSLLGMDLEAGAGRLREIAAIAATPAGDGTDITITIPGQGDAALPELLRDVSALRATVDARGRIHRLAVDLRATGAGAPENITLACTYAERDGDLPGLAEWSLGDGRVVRVETLFRTEAGRRVPHERYIVFPSRYDPGETEEIRVRYGVYDFGAAHAADVLARPELLRFDVNGLIGEASGG